MNRTMMITFILGTMKLDSNIGITKRLRQIPNAWHFSLHIGFCV